MTSEAQEDQGGCHGAHKQNKTAKWLQEHEEGARRAFLGGNTGATTGDYFFQSMVRQSRLSRVPTKK